MESSRMIRRNQDLPFQTLAERVVVVNARSGKVHLLNGTASRIWGLLERGTDAERILATLKEEYEIHSPDQEREVVIFLKELEELGLAAPASEQES